MGKHVPYNQSCLTAGLCSVPSTSKTTLMAVTCQISGQNETSHERGRVQAICGEEKSGSYAACFAKAPPSNLNSLCFLLQLSLSDNLTPDARGRLDEETTPLLSSRFNKFLSCPNNS
ncbi:GTP-binding protein [Venturia nashicola]|nr:GTP-binding protein [Venturia nashicola]